MGPDVRRTAGARRHRRAKGQPSHQSSLMNGVHGSAESVGRKMARQMSVTSSGRTMKRSGCARRSGRYASASFWCKCRAPVSSRSFGGLARTPSFLGSSCCARLEITAPDQWTPDYRGRSRLELPTPSPPTLFRYFRPKRERCIDR